MKRTEPQPQACTPGEVNPSAVLTVLVVGTILAPLDASIVNIALPSIAAEFGERVTAVSWVTTAYLLTSAALLLSMGRLGDMWGLRRVYVTGLVVFAFGAAACAVSPTLQILIAARVLQAVGSSMLFASGPALVTRTFPPNQRGRALGYISIAVSVGLTAGPALGGLLVGTFGWPSVFVANVPLAIAIAFVSWRLLPSECPATGRFDMPGALLSAAALLALLLGLGAADTGDLLAARVWAPVLLSAALLAVFIAWERRAEQPMVDLRLFSSREFSAGVSAGTLAYLALFSVTFTMPFYLLRVQGMDARIAGLLLTITPVVMALVSPQAGRFSDRHGSRLLATAGLFTLALGLGALSLLGTGSSLLHVGAGLLVVGAGMAMFQAPNTAAVLRATPPECAGVGSAFVAEARNVGMAIGVALTAAIMGAALGGAGLPDGTSRLPEAVAETFMSGMSNALMVGAATAVLAVILSWFARGPETYTG